MAVYKRGYQRYNGAMTGRLTRLMVLPGYSWRDLLKKRLMVSLLIISMFWPLGCIGFIYFSNHLDLLVNLGPKFKSFLQIDSRFFLIFMRIQAVFSILIAIFAAPGLIAPDLSNNALQLYFSRPFSRAEYVLSRMIVLLGLLSMVTWIPGIILFSTQSALADGDWFIQNLRLGFGVFTGLLIWIVLVSLVAMAASAYVRRKVMAEAFILGIIFILPVGTRILNNLFDVVWASLFDPLMVMSQIWRSLLGAVPEQGPDVLQCCIAFMLMIVLLLTVLKHKLRPVEVVS
jgi:ABC-2 type transport system permease protein